MFASPSLAKVKIIFNPSLKLTRIFAARPGKEEKIFLNPLIFAMREILAILACCFVATMGAAQNPTQSFTMQDIQTGDTLEYMYQHALKPAFFVVNSRSFLDDGNTIRVTADGPLPDIQLRLTLKPKKFTLPHRLHLKDGKVENFQAASEQQGSIHFLAEGFDLLQTLPEAYSRGGGTLTLRKRR